MTTAAGVVHMTWDCGDRRERGRLVTGLGR